MTDKQAYRQKLQAQLDIWKAEISRLEARAAKLEGEARIAMQKQIDELREHRENIAAQMEQLRQAGDEAWQDVRAGIDGAWRNLDNAVRSAISRFS